LNIAVLVKLVPDTEATIKIDTDRRKIAAGEINFVLNPYDEYAVEEALRLKEKSGGQVTVISLGGDEAAKALRNALAMGADEALQVKNPGGLDMLGVARALAEAIRSRGYDIIFAGKQAVDDDCSAVGTMVAEFLDIAHIATVTKLDIDGSSVTATREVETGVEIFNATLPALITAQKGLNEPRYASLKGIMASKKKVIEEVDGIASKAKVEVVQLNYPPQRPPGRIVGQGVDAVPELVRLLKEEAKVI
jgi:electron transfer flavoprotein beta subunit